MIKRYSLKEMDKIWSDEEKFNIWLKIEILACEAMKHLGKVTNDAFNKIKKSARFNTDEINEIEKTVKHDVIAFLTSVSRSLGDESRYIHMGLTSSDILDTCLSIQVQKASELLLSAIYGLMNILMEKAFKYKETIMMGRSHGVHAEPITFGLKLALWYDEMRRNKQRLMRAAENLRIGKISGAVGTYAHISTYVEEHVCQKLNLMPDTISTQIIQRDRHAEYIMTLSIIAASLDKFASEIRHLQRTEVLEVEESFTPGQKGSSAMPHKRNPIKSENTSGLSRIVKSYASVALDNVNLWHERDISHSSAERIMFPDATGLLYYMLVNFTNIINKLNVYPDRMLSNMDKSYGLYKSQKLMLTLVDKGVSREEAYKMVQDISMKGWNNREVIDNIVLKDENIKKYLSSDQLKVLLSSQTYIKNVDYTFYKVFNVKIDLNN